jgi:UDP-galactopyranose mutase
MNNYDILIVGAGLSGAVIAEQFATKLNKKILVIDNRDHIGGNCYDFIDQRTNILMNKYGAHLFHTNLENVWSYVNKFSEWIRWDHSVVGFVDNKIVPIPVNINTVNSLCEQNIKTQDEMDKWLDTVQIKYDTIKNGEEMAKSRVGIELYEKIFKDYTFKQWNKYPNELNASVLARIPIRNNHDGRYFSDKYQALPKYGYTKFIENILSHPNITIKLNTDFFNIKNTIQNDTIIIYTGPIDRYFQSIGLPKLEYRSIDFVEEVYMNYGYYQTNSVVNYPSKDQKFTRIVEYKHFLNQQSPHTIIVKEFTNDNGEPFYPVPNEQNISLYNSYAELAKLEENKNIFFVGRLANYKYFNMDEAINNALDFFNEKFENKV